MVNLPLCSLFAHFRCRPALGIEATPVAIICPHLYWWRHSVVKWGPTLTLEILELGCWKAIGGSWGLGKSWIRLLMLNIWAAIPINLMQEQTFKFAFHVDSDTLSSPELTRSVEDDEHKLNKSDQWHSSSWRLEEPHEDTRQCTNAPLSRCLQQTGSNVFSLKEKTLYPIFPIHGSTVSQQMVSEGACSCPASTRWGPRPHLLRKGGSRGRVSTGQPGCRRKYKGFGWGWMGLRWVSWE